jgi:hypothetical protein
MRQVLVSPVVSSSCSLLRGDLGLLEGLGEIPLLLQDDGDARGRRHLFEGVVHALPSCLLSNRGNPRPSLLVQAVSAFWRRPLLGGAVRVALGVHVGSRSQA